MMVVELRFIIHEEGFSRTILYEYLYLLVPWTRIRPSIITTHTIMRTWLMSGRRTVHRAITCSKERPHKKCRTINRLSESFERKSSTLTAFHMSHLQYFSYEGVGERNRRKFLYSEAVRVDDRNECADPLWRHIPDNYLHRKDGHGGRRPLERAAANRFDFNKLEGVIDI